MLGQHFLSGSALFDMRISCYVRTTLKTRAFVFQSKKEEQAKERAEEEERKRFLALSDREKVKRWNIQYS